MSPPVPVARPSGFDWVARRGIVSLLLTALFTSLGIWLRGKSGLLRLVGLSGLAVAMWISVTAASTAMSEIGAPQPLQLSLPILTAGEAVELNVSNTPLWRVDLSAFGLAAVLVGIGAIVWSFLWKRETRHREMVRGAGTLLLALGVLWQGGGAPWFFALLALAILILLFLLPAYNCLRDGGKWIKSKLRERREKQEAAKAAESESGSTSGPEPGGVVSASLLLLAVTLFSNGTHAADIPNGFQAADSIQQEWSITHSDARLMASGTISLSGRQGDRFVLLQAPAVLTQFEGEGLRLTKSNVPNLGLTYIVSIPITADNGGAVADVQSEPVVYTATFRFQLEAISATKGVPVLTGTAAVQEVTVNYDEAGWQVECPTAVRIETSESDPDTTKVKALLGPEKASFSFKPQARDVSMEETQFFVEASNLYVPGPGVVDGRHLLHIRTSQGQVSALNVMVPSGLTVSAVSGPVGSWQFDADSGGLKLEIEPPQSKTFDVTIETQRGLDPLPADVSLAPLKVADANGEVGLVAVAFGPDAQPEKLQAQTMSAVNPGDFDAKLMTGKQAALHRVYRYGADGGELALRVAAVEPEVRVISRQVLSLGDERVVLGINFATEITRAGLFQLSFPLPDGFEVETLTGDALHHWAELTEGDTRQIILHLNGKTIGTQKFSLTLSSTAATEIGDWVIPKFALNESSRQSGELVVQPTTGIRLRTVTRQNVSEADPRALGGQGQGALAFRLLQRDWNLVLGIEKLDPWVTGQVLHELTVREGQTRSTLMASFNVQNASIRTLRVVLPISDEDEIRTLRASGRTVSDFVRTDPNSNTWEIQFKRRVVGRILFRIEYERRGDRADESERLSPAAFPDARQMSYYFGIRAGGRLEVDHETLTEGWQRADWNSVPLALREAENRSAPSLTLRAVAPPEVLKINAVRHSLADALKLRVASGSLTTVLSPTGEQLTAVDVTMEVIQRSSLSVGLPEDGELISIFVNGESVNSIRSGKDANAWQFYILPGIDDRTANVRFVYSVTGNRLSSLKLTSPELNVPLENIEWHIVAPKGYELTDNDGNLELVRQTVPEDYDRDSYLAKVRGNRQEQAQQATQLLEQANQLLQAGEQSKARWALNSVANQYALDAASNEDARVQLENLKTQQAIVGLNTRRQRLFLDNSRDEPAIVDNQQLRQAAAANPVLQQDQLNFRPQQLSQLLQGNSTADIAILQQIAGRLVRHQRTTEPAPQAILISLPEDGSIYTFSRSVQVNENAPLELDLDFDRELSLHFWRIALVLVLLAAIAAMFVCVTPKRKVESPEPAEGTSDSPAATNA